MRYDGNYTPPGLESLLERLVNVKPAGPGRWVATCPAHGSGRNKALSIRLNGDKLLLHCFAGCASGAVLNAIDLTWAELYRGDSRPFMRPSRAAAIPRPDERERRKLERLWAAGRPVKPGDLVAEYLAGRGLHLRQHPAVLRYHPSLEFWRAGLFFGEWPGMVARVTHPEHGLVALHRTILTSAGKVKKLTPAVFEGATVGAAIRLFAPQPGQPLALAEGIETALAAHELSGWPVWACISAGGLERVVLPQDVQDVVICADNDHSGVGESAAQKLAMRLLAEGRKVRLAVPPQPGTDWLDVLVAEQGVAQ